MHPCYYRTSPYDYETLKFTLEVLQNIDVPDIPVEKVSSMF